MRKSTARALRQMLNEPDRAPLGPAEQSGEPRLSRDQRQVAQVAELAEKQAQQIERLRWPRPWLRPLRRPW
jgi:hypothetical protein